MGQEVLKPWQRQVIEFLAPLPEFRTFYLTGGTALAAYYLKHRVSDDLDFFSASAIDAMLVYELAERLKATLGAGEMRFSRLHDRNQFFYRLGAEEVKIEFSRYPFPQVEPVNVFDNIAVDSKRDIAVNKLATILDRFDPKDFVDLYFLLQAFSIGELRDGVERKFGLKIDPLFLGSELAKARRIAALPQMTRPLTVKGLKEFFAEEAKKLRPEILE